MPDQLNAQVDLLVSEVHGLRDEVAEQNQIALSAQRSAKSSRVWVQVVAAAFLVGVLAFAAAVIWNRHDISRSNRQWCGTLNILTDPHPTPTTDRGRDSLRELTQLRDSFGCQDT
jgi:hypothetical protein